MEKAKDVFPKIRESRNSNGISPRESLNLFVENTQSTALFKIDGIKEMLIKLGQPKAVLP
ncbi:MAG: hypothetical protein R2788_15915 [Saprospiraceae bacterium]